jgi:excisionase family DNA binding protein
MNSTRIRLTKQQAADFLGVHPRTIDKWRAAGKLAAVKEGRMVLIKGSEILRFVADESKQER